ncbi:MAG: type II toxin-antitoxin system RelE/ParE family toxin [Deltaproteobacteria bacterium]|jgi:toxin ParE1/3/4|nr:type II toxin-antitoxin system RelE/ParE family toxin [Deltaproteobacteria bacterium]
MLPVEWKRAAHADLWAIVDYIADDSQEAAQALKDELVSTIAKLPKNPKMYRMGRVPGTREIVVRKNYIVVYSETPSQITILRILHAAQEYP